MTKYTLNQVRDGLTKRAEAEWAKLMHFEEGCKLGYATKEQTNEQRARWAAYDTAAKFARGLEELRTVNIDGGRGY